MKIGTYWKAMAYPMLLAQGVGLAKLEVAIHLAQWMQDPVQLRLAVYAMGALLTIVVAVLNVWLVRRYTAWR